MKQPPFLWNEQLAHTERRTLSQRAVFDAMSAIGILGAHEMLTNAETALNYAVAWLAAWEAAGRPGAAYCSQCGAPTVTVYPSGPLAPYNVHADCEDQPADPAEDQCQRVEANP